MALKGTGGTIVIFDGTCGFCESSVKFIVRRDRRGHFRFAPSQSAVGSELLAQYRLADEAAQTIVLVEEGRAYRRSTASLRIAARLRWPWSLLRIFLLVPAPLRDAVYDVIAAVRHRLAGPRDVCELPPPEIRERFL